LLGEKSAGAVIYKKEGDQRSFLLLNYPSGHWDFVKGKMEKGETERQTATREAREETGIGDLRFIDGFEQTIEYGFQHGGVPIHKQVVFFLAETGTSDVTLSHEHLRYTWMSFEEALRRVTFDNARSVLTNARNHLLKTSS